MREHRLSSRDGHCWTLAVTEAAPAALGLLWLPALGVPAAKYQRLAQALATRGIQVALHEWRGGGSSNWRASRRQDWGYRELLAEDLPQSWRQARRDAPDIPWLIGGHSLGGQLAALAATQAGEGAAGLVLVASGVPHAATFPRRDRLLIRAFASVLPALTWAVGYYPGRSLGFADREASGLMRDWSRTARHGRYEHYGYPEPFETALGGLRLPVLALGFAADWLAPPTSLQGLLAKIGSQRQEQHLLDAESLGERADHFRWMRQPQAVAARIDAWARQTQRR